uniref:Glycosyl transferase 64 domain-containing protein n=1 Tax=Trichobilharzia regenti TaxID=157069 RepID=A0AA85JWM2_TRIRE|nr:unnamed protein product [Trichobilharzia regenti]
MDSPSTLPFLINELMRINHSVHDELISLHQRRKELVDANSVLQNQVERLRSVLVEQSRQIMRLKVTLDSYQQKISDMNNLPSIFYHKWPVVQIKFDEKFKKHTDSVISNEVCTIESCIDWNRCRHTRFLRFCTDSYILNNSPLSQELLQSSPHFTESCNINHSACLRLLFGIQGIRKCTLERNTNSMNSPTCIVLFQNSSELDDIYRKYNYSTNHQFNFLLVAYSFPQKTFRRGFDFLLPVNYAILCRNSEKMCSNNAPLHLLPGRRSLLLSFKVGILTRSHIRNKFSPLNNWVVKHLKQFDEDSHKKNESGSLISISIYQTNEKKENCWSHKYKEFLIQNSLLDSDWFPCEDGSSLLRQSTFGLIMTPSKNSHLSFGIRVQLVVCLANGAIPVFLGNDNLYSDEGIDEQSLSKAVIRVPLPRVEELPVILQSLPETHIVEIRRQGQILFQRYLKDRSSQLTTLLLAVSRRLGFPQPPAPYYPSKPAYREFTPPKQYPVHKENNIQADLDDFLGPTGPQQSSISYQSNYTGPGGSAHFARVSFHDDANIVNPFWLFPSTPWEPVLPSDAAFKPYASTNYGLRPINHSINLAGYEFNMNLGGMYPYEQFTIVMLTYDRYHLLCQTLESFLNLPYLHSILIIWNNPVPPHPDLSWPQLHVPIKVIHSQNNSLNNRFLPYDLIETDAILSIDDDIQLRHDEIVFGFRIWREHRDQLVGFPARAHFWNASDSSWFYNSDYTCEFSMILTGAAFLHKYYTFAYTWEMSLDIRNMVDSYFNCEDIAMNFLIAHITRKPPLKVTLHWSFDCIYCGSTLHDRPDHYNSRSRCINWLTNHYGYNPLIYSQYRADSLLFKTRIPPNKQKCYKYI